MVRLSVPLLVMAAFLGPAAFADPIGVSGGSLVVTPADCRALVEHRPAPDVAYKPGVDVEGRYVAPADLPGSNDVYRLPDSIQFEIRMNPLAYAGQGNLAGTKYANTQVPLGEVSVDLKTGEASFQGRPLTSAQDRTLREACRKAGFGPH